MNCSDKSTPNRKFSFKRFVAQIKENRSVSSRTCQQEDGNNSSELQDSLKETSHDSATLESSEQLNNYSSSESSANEFDETEDGLGLEGLKENMKHFREKSLLLDGVIQVLSKEISEKAVQDKLSPFSLKTKPLKVENAVEEETSNESQCSSVGVHVELISQDEEKGSANQALDDDPELLIKRKLTINDLLANEQNYVNHLRIFFQEFVHPLREREILPLEQISSIFEKMATIQDVNETFMQNLELLLSSPWKLSAISEPTRVKNFLDRKEEDFVNVDIDKEVELANLFKNSLQDFREYIGFIETFSFATQQISNLNESNKHFRKYLKKTSEKLNEQDIHPHLLAQYMSLPIKRLCDYGLYLDRWRKCMKEEHPAREIMSEALTGLYKIISTCNDRQFEIGNTVRVAEIQQKLHLKNLCIRDRCLVDEGTFQRITSSQNKLSPCVLYLFSDLILCVSLKKMPHKKKRIRGIILGKRVPPSLKEHPDFGNSLCIVNNTVEPHFTDKIQTCAQVNLVFPCESIRNRWKMKILRLIE